MTPNEWAAVGGLILSILAAVYSAMRFLIRAFMRELTPNGGNSLKDQVNRIEARVDALYIKLIDSDHKIV
jgi:hypothetical protein